MSPTTIEGLTITQGQTFFAGAGAVLESSEAVRIVNCTFVANMACDGGGI